MSDILTIDQARDIAKTISWRQENGEKESLEDSIMIVLLNTGDKYTKVDCVRGEWSGVKSDLRMVGGLPHCPNGHPLFEVSGGKRLALVDVMMSSLEAGE